jgi:hypothetical protein
MRLRRLFWYGLFFFVFVLAACGGGSSPSARTDDPTTTQAVDTTPTDIDSPGASPVVDNTQVESQPEDTSPIEVPLASDGNPIPVGLGFNRRATGQGTAVVDGVAYSYEVYVCGDALSWQDDDYPEGSDETAFYLAPTGAGSELRLVGVGPQEDGSLFWIDLRLSRKSGITEAALSLVASDERTRSWSVGSSGLFPSAIAFEAGRFKAADGGISFFNNENASAPVRATFDVTCDTYGGTYDTAADLLSEAPGVPTPGSGQGVFVVDDETFLFDPKTCVISPYDESVIVEGESDGYLLSIELAAEGGGQIVGLTLRGPYRRYGFLVIGAGPIVVDGSRIYTPEPFELKDAGGQAPALFSMDVTCLEMAS